MSTNTSKSLIVIPARMASTRFPGKPMAEAAGMPLVEHTYLRARESSADYIWVVTPDREIGKYCAAKGIPWRPSNENMSNGTARCAEFYNSLTGPMANDIDVVVNWQVDEPLAAAHKVDELIAMVRRCPQMIQTLVAPLPSCAVEMANLNTVKVAVSRFGYCMWFSRQLIDEFGHCGIYGFHPRMLNIVIRMEETRLSRSESLEQLTWIENDIKIHGINMPELPLSINAPQDLEIFKTILGERNEDRIDHPLSGDG